MIKYFFIGLMVLILSGCSTSTFSLYEKGDHFTRSFLDIVPNKEKVTGDYYEVERNKKKQIIQAKHYSRNQVIIEKSFYEYDAKGVLQRHHYLEYFDAGVPRNSKEWIYKNGRIKQRDEQWYTRLRTLEKKLTVFYDDQQKPYMEQTWGLGDRIESSTEYYYDYKNRLDKSRRNFFQLEGDLRDYWLTIYNDELQIMTEEHYFPNNSLITFYRYTYHPVKSYREREEILDADRDVFITRLFDEYGLVLSEEEKDREMRLKNRKVYEYNENHQPKLIHYYGSNGQLIRTAKYKKPQYLEGFRTPGIKE